MGGRRKRSCWHACETRPLTPLMPLLQHLPFLEEALLLLLTVLLTVLLTALLTVLTIAMRGFVVDGSAGSRLPPPGVHQRQPQQLQLPRQLPRRQL